MKKIILHFLLFLFALTSCNKNINTHKKSEEVKDNSFEKTVFKVLEAYNNEDDKTLNQLINKKIEVAILFRRGAHDNLGLTQTINFKEPIPEYLSYSYGFTEYNKNIKYEDLPEFDCNIEQWTKPQGIYCDTLSIDRLRSTIAKDEKKYELSDWPNETIKQLEEIEKTSRKIIVVGKGGGTFIFYLTKQNNNWFLTGIDRFEACSA